MEEQGHSRDGEAGPPAVEMVVLTGVHSPSPRSSYEAITLVAAITLPLIFSPIIFLFASLSVNLLNIFNNLSKARQATT